MQEKSINTIYESCRSTFRNLETIGIESKNISHVELRERIEELLQSMQRKFFKLTDLLIEVMDCENESDLEFLLTQKENENMDLS